MKFLGTLLLSKVFPDMRLINRTSQYFPITQKCITQDVFFKVTSFLSPQIGKNPKEVTYVGLHSRRTDYLEFRKNVLGMKKLYKNYFFDAVDYFTEEFENVVFVYISDDMEWGRKKMRKVANVFFVGCGDSDDQGI